MELSVKMRFPREGNEMRSLTKRCIRRHQYVWLEEERFARRLRGWVSWGKPQEEKPKADGA